MGTRGHTKYMVEEIREMMNPDVVKLFKHFKCYSKLLLNCTKSINLAIEANNSILDNDHSIWDNTNKLLENLQSDSAQKVLLNVFLWDETPEGACYWDKIYTKISHSKLP